MVDALIRTGSTGLELGEQTEDIGVRVGAREWRAVCVRRRETGEGHTGDEHLVMAYGMGPISVRDAVPQPETLVRLHSECLLGDVFSADRCDCRNQLDQAIEMIEHEGRGLIVYLRQEGRGIGLFDKMRSLRADGDTFERNIAVGCPADARGYRLAADILTAFGIHRVRLLSGNPEKISALEAAGITVSPDGALRSGPMSEAAADEIQAKLRRGYRYGIADSVAAHTTPASALAGEHRC